MDKEELKKKILTIVRGAMIEADELPFIETTDYVADALIAAGLTIVENKPYSYKVKNKQEHIEEMAKVIVDKDKAWEYSSCKKCDQEKCNSLCYKYCGISGHCNILYTAGYRKQSDVIKEFVEKVKDKFFYELDSERSINTVSIYRFTDKEIDELAAEFGAEVEE